MPSKTVVVKHTLGDYLPIIKTLQNYEPHHFRNDLLAGLIVAIMLIPQGMAYALLAGLPAQVGLYASLLPLLLYGLLGSSRYLAVGPVAIVSLMTAPASIESLAPANNAMLLQLALTLALLVGLIQVGMGLFRIGFAVKLLTHPILVGFTAAAAIVIGFSQVKNLLGITVPRTEQFYEQVIYVFAHLSQIHWPSLIMGCFGIITLIYFKDHLSSHLQSMNVSSQWADSISKSGPLIIVVVSTLISWYWQLNQNVQLSVVGHVPAGWPELTRPSFEMATWQALLATAVTISLVGYMESISVAKSLAHERQQTVDANQELIALGVANMGAAFTGGYPVTGGFSRSLVNFTAGAQTTVASIITALLIGGALLFLTPLFYFLPTATLAAIILVAVLGLIQPQAFREIWQHSYKEGLILMITFVAVLMIGIEWGIVIGVLSHIIFHRKRFTPKQKQDSL